MVWDFNLVFGAHEKRSNLPLHVACYEFYLAIVASNLFPTSSVGDSFI